MNSEEIMKTQEKLISEQERTIESLLRYLKHVGPEEARQADPGTLLYGVYEISAGEKTIFVAVCVDNPFIYAASVQQDKAVKMIRDKIREFYLDGDIPSNGLEEIDIPNHLPEDF